MSNKNSSIKLTDITLCAMFAGIIIIMSQISIPLVGGVPFTLQTLGIALVGILLGSKKGFITVLVYVLLGAVGLPIFSGFKGGLQSIIGPTGGFIISFPIMAYIIGYISERSNNKYIIFLGVTIGSIINFAFGVIMFSLVTKSTISNSIMVCVVPFIPTTIIKIFISTVLGIQVKRGMLKSKLV